MDTDGQPQRATDFVGHAEHQSRLYGDSCHAPYCGFLIEDMQYAKQQGGYSQCPEGVPPFVYIAEDDAPEDDFLATCYEAEECELGVKSAAESC